MTISHFLESKLRAALDGADARVTIATDARFGDYQTNAAMILAKQQRANPRQIAQQIIDRLDVAELCEPPEIAGAGFINFRLKPAWLAQRFAALCADEKLGVPAPAQPRKIVIDFSSPNVAKPMHVGHIRSTILGDALARIAAFLGHEVVRDNHIGDWGTQFGMLIFGWNHLLVPKSLQRWPINELERLYKYTSFFAKLPPHGLEAVKSTLDGLQKDDSTTYMKWQSLRKLDEREFDQQFSDELVTELYFSRGEKSAFEASIAALKGSGFLSIKLKRGIHPKRLTRLSKAIGVAIATVSSAGGRSVMELCRNELVKLQSGDAENLALWREMQRLSQAQFDAIYGRLGVRFDVALGESFYNDRLKPVVADLRARGIATESEGALCVFSDGALKQEDDPFLIKDKDGWRANPALVQKSDGAANYTTTDLATLDYRISQWAPDEIVYVTDGRQQLHFRQLFAIFRRWKPDARVKLAHVWFGSINGDDGKPFKTRSGDTIKLTDLLDEAEERALQLVVEKNPDLPDAERREIARIVGIGAVKYADLLPNRQSDYVFSWDKMLSFQGNTAPYLQYSYVRIRSIFRKAGHEFQIADCRLQIADPAEFALAKKLLQFGEVLPQVLDDFRPNALASYLYELAGLFHSFFEACPVLKSEGVTRDSRLALCDTTARLLRHGLALLGIEVPERM